MSETKPDSTAGTEQKAAKPVKHKKRKPKQASGFFKFIIILVVLGLAGFGIWRYGLKSWHDYRARITGLEAMVTAMQTKQKKSQTDTETQLKAMQDRQDHLEQGVGSLLEQNGHMRKDWLVAEAEYLLKLASHRLLLEQDIPTAIVALEAANTRLGEIGDPGVIKVRKQISKDISKLKKLPVQDTSGISLTLSTLVQDVTQLPLRTPDPEDIKQRINEQQAQSRKAKSAQEFVSLVWQDLKSLVNYRRHDQPVQPLLQPEQRFFLVQNLQLKLEQARLALLRSEHAIYQERVQEAQKWVQQYFDPEHSTTLTVKQNLKTLSEFKPLTDLPELSRSYQALQQYRLSGQRKTSSKPKTSKPVAKPVPAKKNKPKAKPEKKPDPKPEQKAPEVKPDSPASESGKVEL